MILYGKIESTNMADGYVNFDATKQEVYGAESPVEQHHELHGLAETDEGGEYECWDTHGRKWLLIDMEDEAELHLLEG